MGAGAGAGVAGPSRSANGSLGEAAAGGAPKRSANGSAVGDAVGGAGIGTGAGAGRGAGRGWGGFVRDSPADERITVRPSTAGGRDWVGTLNVTRMA